MLCNECGKNEATVHVTQIVNGKKTEKHLCDSCAKSNDEDLNLNFSLENLFSSMLNSNFGKSSYMQDSECPVCKMTYEQFREAGKFGCGSCIKTFKQKLMPAVKNIQGYDNHKGKVPKRTGGSFKLQKDIERLKEELKFAVIQEDYEAAAKLRDKIREIEKNI